MFSTRPSVRPSVCSSQLPNCEQDILKTNKPNFLQIGTGDPRGKETKRSPFGVRRSNINVIYTRPELDLETGRRHLSRSLRSSKFSKDVSNHFLGHPEFLYCWREVNSYQSSKVSITSTKCDIVYVKLWLLINETDFILTFTDFIVFEKFIYYAVTVHKT